MSKKKVSKSKSELPPFRAEWAAAASMRVARADAAAAAPTVGTWAGLLAVSGGLTGAGGKVSGVVEIYDPTTDVWTEGPALATPRYGHAMWVEPDGSFIVAGGRDATGAYLTSCERLSTSAVGELKSEAGTMVAVAIAGRRPHYQWLPAGDLPEARFRAAAVAFS